MWIDRLDRRLDAWFENFRFLPVLVAVGLLLITAELLAMGWVARGQVERSQEQQASLAAYRTRLVDCFGAGSAARIDNCRYEVMASMGSAPVARAGTQLAAWKNNAARVADAAGVAPIPQAPLPMARAGIVSVSLVGLAP